jgi:L-ascorbate metabolism protein UlaG (beta-lactamase superfamily)
MKDVRITHIGGPTALIEVEGRRLLTDPTFDPPGFQQDREAIEREFAKAPEDMRRSIWWLPIGVAVEIVT